MKISPNIVDPIVRKITVKLYNALKAIQSNEISVSKTNSFKTMLDYIFVPVDTERSQQTKDKSDMEIHKVVFGVTECGFINFISDLHKSKVSNEKILSNPKFLSKINENDAVLANFEMANIFKDKRVELKTSVLKNTENPQEIERLGRNYAFYKSHLLPRRIILKLKKIDMLENGIPFELRFLANEIVFNCIWLRNFKAPLT